MIAIIADLVTVQFVPDQAGELGRGTGIGIKAAVQTLSFVQINHQIDLLRILRHVEGFGCKHPLARIALALLTRVKRHPGPIVSQAWRVIQRP